MLVERQPGILLVVLRADGEDDPALRQGFGVALERSERLAAGTPLAQQYAFEAVVADHSAPHRVVEVENEAFRRAADPGGDDPGDELAVHRRGGGRDLLPGPMPQGRIVPRIEAVGTDRLVDGEEVHLVLLGSGAEPRIEGRDEALGRAWKPMLVAPGQSRRRRQEGLLDHPRAEVPRRVAPGAPQ